MFQNTRTCFRIREEMAPTKKYAKQSKRKNGVYKKSYKKKSKSPAFADAYKTHNPEKKWIDVVNTLVPPIGSAFVTTPLHLNPTASGTAGGGQRVGSKITMSSLQIRANALWPGGQVTNSPSQVRYLVVYDKQANAAAPSRSDVFADGTLWNSPINLTNQERFVILADVLGDQIGSNGQFSVATELFRKMALDAVWPPGGSAYPNTGSITLWVAANQNWNSASGGVLPDVQIYSRIRFTDC